MRLTRDEILLITFIVVALVVGAAVKHYRDRGRLTATPAATHPLEVNQEERLLGPSPIR